MQAILSVSVSTSEQLHKCTVLQNGQDKTRKRISRSRQSFNSSQDFLNMPSLREVALETSEDAFQKSSWNQMLLPIYQGHQIHSAQFRQQLMEDNGDALCVT